MQLHFRYALAVIVVLSLAPTLGAQELPAYHPRPVATQKDAPYLLPDGSIYIVAGDDMKEILTRFNELFTRTHPGFKFKLLLSGGSSTAMGGLTAGVSAFALMDREAWPLEIRPFRQVYGYEPTDIRIGRAGYCARGTNCPPGVYVNTRNPLTGLTVEQVARIFTAGGGKGDLTHWGQVGLKGKWAQRAIHVYGPRDDGTWASAVRHDKMGGYPFTRRYEPLSAAAETIEAVAEDPYGIGLVGSFDAKSLLPGTKMLPLAKAEGAPYATGIYSDVLSGKYPFSPFLHLYVNQAGGKPLDPFVKEYARLVLSREGQAIIAAQKGRRQGYVPLSPPEVARELAKLE